MTKTRKLIDVAEILMGQSPTGDTYNSHGEGIPLINGPTEFGSISPNVTLFTTDSKRACEKDDLIFCVRGSTTGRMNWADKTYSLGRGVCSFRGKNKLQTRFIRYCLEVNLEALLKQAGGGTFPNLTKDTIFNFEIPFPDDLETFAEIVDKYDQNIENNSRRIAILEEIAQSLYREWFVKLRYPGHENQKMVESPLGLIPEGWEVKKLNELVILRRKTAKKGKLKDLIPYMGLEHFPRKSIALSNWDTVDEIGSNKLEFKKGDILFGKIRPYFHKVGVAQIDGICSTDTFVMFPNNELHHPLIAMVTFSDEFVAQAVQTSQGTKMPRASWDVLAEYLVAIPPKDMLLKFNSVISPAINNIAVLSAKNRNLKTQRDMLLPKLISGQIIFSEEGNE